MGAANIYRVTASSMEELLGILRPLGETIQYSAQKRQPVTFTQQSLLNFGNALEHVEQEVKRQRVATEEGFWQRP